jgi:hypothetical protein
MSKNKNALTRSLAAGRPLATDWHIRRQLIIVPTLAIVLCLSCLGCLIKFALDKSFLLQHVSINALFFASCCISILTVFFVFRKRGRVFYAQGGHAIKVFASTSSILASFCLPIWLSDELQRPVLVDSIETIRDWRTIDYIAPINRDINLSNIEHQSVQQVTGRHKDTYSAMEIFWIPMTTNQNVHIKVVYQDSIRNSASFDEKRALISNLELFAKEQLTLTSFNDARYFKVGIPEDDQSGNSAVLHAKFTTFDEMLKQQRIFAGWISGFLLVLWLMIAAAAKPDLEIFRRYKQGDLTTKWF